ncbi:MAG: dihydroorotate dehydrogenase electron transfer subunit [Lachnospiraceae bacterium]|nr:dihydroorotate dehydrogenase electron transfer subunit [Lachnospiraceae bacterium]
MAEQFYETAKVISKEIIAKDIYKLVLKADKIANSAKAGQFVLVYPHLSDKKLGRPISICDWDKDNGTITLCYRVTGENTGTREFSSYCENDEVRILGPLGNGFPMADGNILIIGGGLGIFPLLGLSKTLTGKKTIALGFREEIFLMRDFNEYGDLIVATETGITDSFKGNIVQALREEGNRYEVIYACGPTPMLKAVKEFAAEQSAICYLSLEERMACGIGACLACVCKSKEIDGHTNVKNKRVCKEGPVFEAHEIEF